MSNKDKQKLSPQTRKLLDYLKDKKTITAVEARAVFQIEALPRRIADLKEAGWDITSTLKKDAQGKRYARYTFNGKAKGQVDSKGKPKVLESEKPKRELKVGARIKVINNVGSEAFVRDYPAKEFPYYLIGEEGTVIGIASDGDPKVEFGTVRPADRDYWGNNRTLAYVSKGGFEVIAHG